ncbi:hypothetical protein AGMMS49525_10220 [Bacteroidia bacterium]|nr:hypothetical protein AGMMS49525_10220 [Bacteroidia bacterium]
MKESIKIFEEKNVRAAWDEASEEWYFSVVDVVSILTDSIDPSAYWRKLKQRLRVEGNETVTICHGLKKENLRDNMTNTELVLNMLAELSTKQISETANPDSFDEHLNVAKQGGEIAKNARLELESKTGKSAISSLNAKTGILPSKKD